MSAEMCKAELLCYEYLKKIKEIEEQRSYDKENDTTSVYKMEYDKDGVNTNCISAVERLDDMRSELHHQLAEAIGVPDFLIAMLNMRETLPDNGSVLYKRLLKVKAKGWV